MEVLKGDDMSNQPNINNVQRSVRVPRELDAKVWKRFGDEGMTVKDAYLVALEFATMKVTLTAEDHERIASEIRAAKNHSPRKGAKK